MAEITIKDVARLCGVGVSTVSRAINNHPDINPETKTQILNVIKENNYIPNNSARNLKRQDAKAIAVLVKGITNSFFSEMIKTMEQEIKRRKYSLVLHHVDFNEDEVDVALELVKEKRLRGIIFLGGVFQQNEEKLGQLQVPFVLSTTGAYPETYSKKTYSSVSVNDMKESYKVVDYLCKTGHKDIAFIGAKPADRSIGKLRHDGYLQALEDNHLPYKKELDLTMKPDIEDYSLLNGYTVTKEFLEKKIPCTALYAISDIMAIGAMRAIKEAGLQIPQDISVAGFDGVNMGGYITPSLTTLVQPIDEMALETAKQLFDVISKNAEHQHKVLEGKLLVRESTRKIETSA